MNFRANYLTAKYKPANYFTNTKVERNCENLAPWKLPAIIMIKYAHVHYEYYKLCP